MTGITGRNEPISSRSRLHNDIYNDIDFFGGFIYCSRLLSSNKKSLPFMKNEGESLSLAT